MSIAQQLLDTAAYVDDIQGGVNAIKAAIEAKDVDCTGAKLVDLPAKVAAITTGGGGTVNPIQGVPSNWHNLAVEIANWQDEDYPYCMALLLQGRTTGFYLSGASKYKTSDGQIYTSDQYITIGANTDATKLTKYVIFRYATPFISFDASNYTNIPTLFRKIIMGYNYNVAMTNISFTNSTLMHWINDTALRNPIVKDGVRTMMSLRAYGFQNTHLDNYSCVAFRDDATDVEKATYTIPTYCFHSSYIREFYLPAAKKIVFDAYSFFGSKLKYIEFDDNTESIELKGNTLVSAIISAIKWPANLKSLTAFGSSNMSITSDVFEFPSNLETIILGDAFFNGSFAQHFILKKASVSYSGGSQPFYGCAPRIVELEDNWPHSQIIGGLSNYSAANMTASSLETYTLNRLMDLHTMQGRIPYIKTEGASLVTWIACDSTGITLDSHGDSAKFTEIFRVGEVVKVTISGTVRSFTIQSIDSDNQMTMTGTAYMVAGTYMLDHNKVLTLTSVLLNLLSSAQKAIATNKLWTLA